jgi:hypothetical protein
LNTKPLTLAPGAAEADAEHDLLLCPAFACSISNTPRSADASHPILVELATSAQGQAEEHRDAAILLSLPGLGRKVGATMLSEASQAIADRDYPRPALL